MILPPGTPPLTYSFIFLTQRNSYGQFQVPSTLRMSSLKTLEKHVSSTVIEMARVEKTTALVIYHFFLESTYRKVRQCTLFQTSNIMDCFLFSLCDGIKRAILFKFKIPFLKSHQDNSWHSYMIKRSLYFYHDISCLQSSFVHHYLQHAKCY